MVESQLPAVGDPRAHTVLFYMELHPRVFPPLGEISDTSFLSHRTLTHRLPGPLGAYWMGRGPTCSGPRGVGGVLEIRGVPGALGFSHQPNDLACESQDNLVRKF